MFLDFTSYKHLNFVDYLALDNWSSHFLIASKISYNDKYPLVKIGSFLKRKKETVSIKDDVLYKRPTIQMNAKGIKLRDEVLGRMIGTKKQFKVNKGQFLLSKIDARNGAFGVVPVELDDSVITGNFWTFDVNYDLINPFYLSLLTGTEQFQTLCQTASVGTTNRNYLQQDLFLNFEIPLPTIPEQNKLADDYSSKIKDVERYLQKADEVEKIKSSFLNSQFGIKDNIIKRKKSFSFIDYSNLNKWGVSFAAYQSKWKIVPKYKVSKLNSFSKIGSGGTPDKSRPQYFNGNIPWVKTTEVINEVIYNTEEHLSEEGLLNSSAKIYPPGSLLIAMYGQGLTRGRTAKLGISAATNQACAVIHEIDNHLILTDFLWLYLINEYERLREMASGNNQPNLNAGMISDYYIQIPPKKIQKGILSRVRKYNIQIANLKIEAEKNKSESLRDFAASIFS